MAKLSISNMSDIGGFKNKIINGNFEIWQRHTIHTAVPTGDYTADRWFHGTVGAAVHTHAQSTQVPTLSESGTTINHSTRVFVTTADASLAATDHSYICQVLEGYTYKDLIGKQCTLSFWAKAYQTGTYCVSFRNNGKDRSYVAEYTINTTDTWQFFEIPITFNQSGGTEEYDTDSGLYVTFCIATGTTYQTTPNVWQTGNYLGTSNQVNGTATTSDDLYLTQVQLEIGSVATPFETRSFGQEVTMCQRYFSKSYTIDTAPASATTTGVDFWFLGAATIEGWTVSFPVEMRTAPTVVLYSSDDGATGKVRTTSNQDGTPSQISTRRCRVDNDGTLDRVTYVHWTADAELS